MLGKREFQFLSCLYLVQFCKVHYFVSSSSFRNPSVRTYVDLFSGKRKRLPLLPNQCDLLFILLKE